MRQQLRLMYGGGFMPNWPGTTAQLRRFDTVRGFLDEEFMASIEAWQLWASVRTGKHRQAVVG